MTPEERHTLLKKRRTAKSPWRHPGPGHAGKQIIRVAVHKAAIDRNLPRLYKLLELTHLSTTEAAREMGYRDHTGLNKLLRQYTGKGDWPCEERIREAIHKMEEAKAPSTAS